MTDTVLVALLSLAGTAIGSILGIYANNKLVIYRLEQLEKKVGEHNGVVKRVDDLERDVGDLQEDFVELKKDVNRLKEGKAS